MAKIAFVTIRYGLEVNGGAEYHCRMLAERLSANHEVSVLCSTIKSIKDPTLQYPIGEDRLNGVTIKRFERSVEQGNKKPNHIARKARRLIFRSGLSKFIFNLFPTWRFKIEEEEQQLKQHYFYSSDLLQYIESNKNNIDVYIYLTYENPLTVLGALSVPNKSILIPTAHMESMLFRSINTLLFSKVRHIAFNTETEMQMCRSIFPKMAAHSVIGVGVEIAEATDWSIVQKKYQINTAYILYSGRINKLKINSFLTYFKRFRAETNIDLNLVLTGDILMEKEVHQNIIYTGFVTEEEKIALIKQCLAVVNPSIAESLSLITLEALSLGKPVIGNRKSDVMYEHQINSQGAVQCYHSYSSFKNILVGLSKYPTESKIIAEKAIDYVNQKYNWTIIIAKFEQLIKNISN